jgi:hypothetical protein
MPSLRLIDEGFHDFVSNTAGAAGVLEGVAEAVETVLRPQHADGPEKLAEFAGEIGRVVSLGRHSDAGEETSGLAR